MDQSHYVDSSFTEYLPIEAFFCNAKVHLSHVLLLLFCFHAMYGTFHLPSLHLLHLLHLPFWVLLGCIGGYVTFFFCKHKHGVLHQVPLLMLWLVSIIHPNLG